MERLALQVASGTGSCIAMGALLCVPPLTSGRIFLQGLAAKQQSGCRCLGSGRFLVAFCAVACAGIAVFGFPKLRECVFWAYSQSAFLFQSQLTIHDLPLFKNGF